MTPLEQAARAAQHAPSVFNTQPWNWRTTGDGPPATFRSCTPTRNAA